jgi:hypothetical protein
MLSTRLRDTARAYAAKNATTPTRNTPKATTAARSRGKPSTAAPSAAVAVNSAVPA